MAAGTTARTVVPASALVSRRSVPPSWPTRSLTIASPSPWPETAVITGLVLSPDR